MNSTATQPTLLELAKQGNAQAIATLINRQLKPKGITAKAALKDGCLQVMLESAQVPNQQALVAFISKGLTGLGVASIERVKIYGRQAGEEFPAWNRDFELAGQQSPFLNSKTAQSETSKADTQPKATQIPSTSLPANSSLTNQNHRVQELEPSFSQNNQSNRKIKLNSMTKEFHQAIRHNGDISHLLNAVDKVIAQMGLQVKERRLDNQYFSFHLSEQMHWLTTNWPNQFSLIGEVDKAGCVLTVSGGSKFFSITQEADCQRKVQEIVNLVKAYLRPMFTTISQESELASKQPKISPNTNCSVISNNVNVNITAALPIVTVKNQDKPWYEKDFGIILLFIFFWPVGLYLMWKYSEWSTPVKWTLTAICSFMFFTAIS